MTITSAGKVPSSNVETQLSTDDRDVKDLWQEALKGYQGIVGFDLERKFDNVQTMLDFGTEQMNNFHKFRHDKGKVDRLRTLFASNLDYVEKGANQIIGAATPAFPPAAAIGTALTYVLQACRYVSADYDIVIVFFEDMNSFLQRISILESRLPQKKAYQNCLVDVFTSILNMCGFAHKYIELGRFKKWITNLFQGEDSELGGARAVMNKSLSNLQQATEFAILGNAEETLKMTTQLNENQRSHTEMLEKFGNTMDSIHENTENIKDDVAKLLKLFGAKQKKESQMNSPQAGSASSAKGVRNIMPVVSNDDHEYRVLKETLIPGSCSWVFSEPQWEQWLKIEDGERPVLAITGQPGTGKSHLAAAIHDKLEEKAREDESGHTCVVHFYFREQDLTFSVLVLGLVSLINQIAENNVAACEKLKAQIARDDISFSTQQWEHLSEYLLKPVFDQDSKFHLFIVLDGLDEILDWMNFKEFLSKHIIQNRLRISLVVTSRPKRLEDLDSNVELLRVEATKERQRQDFKLLIWHRINSLGCLRKFSRYVQQRVADTVEEISPNLLYAEHTLSRLDTLGREGAVLKALKQKSPDDLHGIYESLLAECQRRMPFGHQQIVASVLHWIACTGRRLTLGEVQSLARHISQDDTFSLEDIPELFSKFLKLGDPGDDAELRAKARASKTTMVQDLKQNEDDEDDIYDDETFPVKFQERSMRYYFIDSLHDSSPLRWGPSEAHRRIFLSCTKLFQPSCVGVDEGLREYCALYLSGHWYETKIDQHTCEEQIEVLEAFAEAFSDKTGLAEMLGKAGVKYHASHTKETDDRIKDWAKLIEQQEIKDGLSNSAFEWWSGVGRDPGTFRLDLAKGYLRDLYQSTTLQEAMKAWQRLLGVLMKMGKGPILMDQARRNFPDQFEVSKTCDSDMTAFDESRATLGILGLFIEDVTPDAGGHRAVAEVLFETGYSTPAEKTCRAALSLCTTSGIEWYRTSCILCNILLRLEKKEDACQVARTAAAEVSSVEMPGHLKRAVCTTYARAQTELGLFDAANESYGKAKAMDADGITPASDLVGELDVLQRQADHAGFIQVLKSWSLLERITWAASNYVPECEDRLARFCNAAVATGEQRFIIEFYEQAVDFLDNLEAGMPFRLDLAVAYFYVRNDAEKAAEILDEIFDSHVTTGLVFPITAASPVWLVDMSVRMMANVQVELFRKSRDPVYKAKRISALESLMQRPLSLDVPHTSPSITSPIQVGLSYMYLAMGPKAKFQETLQLLFDKSFAGLSDSVGSNDSPYVYSLAQALALLGRALGNDGTLRRYALIVGSAMLSRLDKPRDEDVELLEDEEDLSEPDPDEAWLTCSGFCSPSRPFSRWGDRSAYLYIAFDIGLICDDCQSKVEAVKRGEGTGKFRHFHGIGHDYLKLPIEGWRGVKNGMLRLEGEEPVPFKDFLKKLQAEVINNAWDRLWSEEI